MITLFVIVQQVRLVEYEYHGYTVCFGRSEEAVDERGGGLWLHDRNKQKRLVNVGGNDMALFSEVDALADDVVAAVLNLHNKIIANLNSVAYGHRIRAPYATQTEIAFYFTINKLAIVRADGVPASCILNDETF